MSRAQVHPEISELQELLRDELSGVRQEEVVSHLDDCADCQARLEALAGGEANAAALRQDGPARDSAFWPAMQALQSRPSRDSERLTPAPEPDTELAARTPQDPVTVLDASKPAATREVSFAFLDPSDEPGSLGKLGDFSVVELIGRGGMGIVLKGLDVCLQRHVAIKVLDPQVAKNEIAIERFCREARAAAAVTHENVVAVHQVEYDEAKDLPYLIMQYVAGETLQDRLDREGALELTEILRIGMQTASGLAAAHAQGLIHRDVKPGNILLEQGTGQVRLTDFGLARATEDVKLTQTGFVAGTPLYMAPEQAQGEKVDHRTDLFSLGSVLYAMCTGRPPFAGSTPFVVLKSVTEQTPKPVREINPAIPEWLEDVIERLHAKKPDERWQSAAELAALFRQKLVEVQAAAPGKQTPSLPVRALGSRRLTRGMLIWARIGQGLTALLVLLAITELLGWTRLLNRPGAADGVVSPQHLKTLVANSGPIWTTAFSPDGKTLLMGIDDGTIKVWDVDSGRVKSTINAHNGPVWSVAFTREGDRFASGGDDGAKLWDAATNKEVLTFPHDSGVRAVAFSPNAERLVTGTRNGKILLWHTRKRTLLEKIQAHTGNVTSLDYSRDGTTIASASSDKTIKLWNAENAQEQLVLQGHAGGVYSVAIAPDGKTIASGSWDRTVRLWNGDTGNQLRVLSGHAQPIWSVAFAPDGATLASAGEDHTVRVWDTGTGREITTLRGHSSTVHSVVFSRGGDMIASGGRDGAVLLWRAP